MTEYVFRWNGQYFGFICDDKFFDAKSNWIGWIEGSEVWRSDGEFLGELFENCYVLREQKMMPKLSKIPPAPPVPPPPPIHA